MVTRFISLLKVPGSRHWLFAMAFLALSATLTIALPAAVEQTFGGGRLAAAAVSVLATGALTWVALSRLSPKKVAQKSSGGTDKEERRRGRRKLVVFCLPAVYIIAAAYTVILIGEVATALGARGWPHILTIIGYVTIAGVFWYKVYRSECGGGPKARPRPRTTTK